MRTSWQTPLAITLLLVGALSKMFAEDNKRASQSASVQDVLPKATPSPQLETLKKQLSFVIAFRDPITGELRSPDPGEHGTLAGSSAGTARMSAPQVGQLPSGGRYLRFDPAKLRWATAVGAPTNKEGQNEK